MTAATRLRRCLQVDFASAYWTAWGVRLLSEHGYGTISSNTGDGDTSRMATADGSPAGHNTLIVRQASPEWESGAGDPAASSSTTWGTAGEVTFSQLPNQDGTVAWVEPASTQNDDGGWSGVLFGRPCVDLDGGKVYGSDRSDGFFDFFHRYACPLPGGHFLMIDSLSAKANRSALRLWGGSYGGESFAEATDDQGRASQTLDVDSYFHTPAETTLDETTGEETTFSRASLSSDSRCSHVEAVAATSLAARRATSVPPPLDLVLLTPRCGLQSSNRNSFRDTDGVATVAGYSSSSSSPGLTSGNFTVDGLVSADATGGTTTYLRRFRWQSREPVGPDGQVRAYVLASAAASNTSVGAYRQGSNASYSLWVGDVVSDDSHDESDAWTNMLDSASEDALLEASVATVAATAASEVGFPIAWAVTCPAVPAASNSRFGGCSAPQTTEQAASNGDACVCVEACAGGRLYWATLSGAAVTDDHGAAMTLSRVAWSGRCNESHALRRTSLEALVQSALPVPAPTTVPAPAPTAVPVPTPTVVPVPTPNMVPGDPTALPIPAPTAAPVSTSAVPVPSPTMVPVPTPTMTPVGPTALPIPAPTAAPVSTSTVTASVSLSGLVCEQYTSAEESILITALASTLDGVEESDIGPTTCDDAAGRRRLLSGSVSISFSITLTSTSASDTPTSVADAVSTSLAAAVSAGTLASNINTAAAGSTSAIAAATVTGASAVATTTAPTVTASSYLTPTPSTALLHAGSGDDGTLNDNFFAISTLVLVVVGIICSGCAVAACVFYKFPRKDSTKHEGVFRRSKSQDVELTSGMDARNRDSDVTGPARANPIFPR